MAELLSQKNKLLTKKKLKIYQIFSALPNSEQIKVFENIDRVQYRKVILATNIAETSITIKNIQFVVDSGYFKIKTFDSNSGLDILSLSFVSQNSAIQRAGRAGRDSVGKCFRLYTESQYVNFDKYIIPVLLIITLGNI